MSLNTTPSADAVPAEQSATERRQGARFRCCRKCNVWPQGGTGAGAWPGIVYNISTTGIGVVLPCPLVAGTVLTIESFGGRKDQRVRARVSRSVLQSFAFFHGCEFLEPLTDDQVQAWLR